jgi:hypothetical protein
MDELLAAKIDVRKKAKAKVKGLTRLKPDTRRQEARVKYVIEKDEIYAYTYLVTGAGFKVLLRRKALQEEKTFEITSVQEAKRCDQSLQNQDLTYRQANAPFLDCQTFLACQKITASVKLTNENSHPEKKYAKDGTIWKDIILYLRNNDN